MVEVSEDFGQLITVASVRALTVATKFNSATDSCYNLAMHLEGTVPSCVIITASFNRYCLSVFDNLHSRKRNFNSSFYKVLKHSSSV